MDEQLNIEGRQCQGRVSGKTIRKKTIMKFCASHLFDHFLAGPSSEATSNVGYSVQLNFSTMLKAVLNAQTAVCMSVKCRKRSVTCFCGISVQKINLIKIINN